MSEDPDEKLIEKLDEQPLSVSKWVNGKLVFGHMVNGEFVPDPESK